MRIPAFVKPPPRPCSRPRPRPRPCSCPPPARRHPKNRPFAHMPPAGRGQARVCAGRRLHVAIEELELCRRGAYSQKDASRRLLGITFTDFRVCRPCIHRVCFVCTYVQLLTTPMMPTLARGVMRSSRLTNAQERSQQLRSARRQLWHLT